MSEVVEKHFQELLRPANDQASDSDHAEQRRLEQGFRYRIAGRGQYPLLQMMLLLKNGNAVEIKYAYITERYFNRHDPESGANTIVIRVRDTQQITIEGFNLERLNDDLLVQRVMDIGSVEMLQAKAALKADPAAAVITDIKIEHGRMDMENGIWMSGSGEWSDSEQRWIPTLIPDVQNWHPADDSQLP